MTENRSTREKEEELGEEIGRKLQIKGNSLNLKEICRLNFLKKNVNII